ncbi:hypothetical protein [Vibrio parahaemolyticus]|uniref:hypothetical protein n=1 Tax=Vibrio parahaemolyticus TaxID=670 RepID=UPI00111EE316|nr:hypothetical protein [Vibrio parahaemolyticus]TOB50017.1 hypothetical protein CGK03_24470 [Vibrio parahaemolyticus]
MKEQELLKLKAQLKEEIKAELNADNSTPLYQSNHLSTGLTAAVFLLILTIAVALTLTSRYFITGNYDVAITKQLVQTISAVLAISGVGLAVHDQFFFPKIAIIFSLFSAGLAAFSNFLG